MIKALIIDDEDRARNSLLAALQAYCPDVEVIGQAANVPDAADLIRELNPDLVFLDIEMPQYNGFELMTFLPEINFDVIFVTAYSQYAIQAFEVSAIDYILKPIDVNTLCKAVDKVKQKHSKTTVQKRLEILKETFINEEIRKISLPMSDGLLFVEVKDIILLKADGAYTNVYLHNGSRILVSKKLRFFEEVLVSRPNFFRPHRSYLININYIRKYTRAENSIVMDNNAEVAISRDIKSQFEALLKEYRLSI